MADPKDPQDPRYATILKALEESGRWTPEQSRNLTDHLFDQIRVDPLMKRVDEVVIRGEGVDARVFAISKSDADPTMMFSKYVDGSKRDTAVVGQDGYLTDPSITRNPIAALEKGDLKQVNAIVMHRTEGATAQSALDSFKTGTGTHFLIDKDGTIYQTASLDETTQHVGKIRSRAQQEGTWTPEDKKTIEAMGWAPGKLHEYEAKKSYPDRYPMNADSVGIEVVGRYNEKTKTWDPPTPEQTASIQKLVGMLQTQYGLTDRDVYPHDKISYKTAGEGVGLWQPPVPAVEPPRVQRPSIP